MLHCEVCGIEVEPSRHGRPRKYCSERCRSRARRAKPSGTRARQLYLVPRGEAPPAPDPEQGEFIPDVHDLHKDAKKWVRQVFRGWEIPESMRPLVLQAGAVLSRALEARETIDQEGPILRGEGGSRRTHPAVRIERDSTDLFSKLLKQLDLQ